MEIQQRLSKPKLNYSYGSYNKFDDQEQWVRLTEGCPHNCPYCYEPQEIKVFEIPDIIRNKVSVMDMNLLCKPEALKIIKQLGEARPNGKVVHYDMVCGIDYRFLTKELADALKKSRFDKIRIAWDWYYRDQYQIKDAIERLLKAGYKRGNIMIFMICNWKIPYEECLKKLDLCKIWNVQVADCYFDNQTGPDFIPLHWKLDHIKDFRRRCRKHNQLVNFKIDPEVRSFPLNSEPR